MIKTNSVKYIILLSLSLILTIGSAFQVMHHWKIKSNFNIKFTQANAEGVFEKFTGEIHFDERDPQKAKFDVKIDVRSVETGNPMRNESITSENWLDAKTYPNVSFKADSATKADGIWTTKGLLEIRGVKQKVSIPFTFRKTTTDTLFESTFKIKMMDYNLSDDPEERLTLHLKVPVTE